MVYLPCHLLKSHGKGKDVSLGCALSTRPGTLGLGLVSPLLLCASVSPTVKYRCSSGYSTSATQLWDSMKRMLFLPPEGVLQRQEFTQSLVQKGEAQRWSEILPSALEGTRKRQKQTWDKFLPKDSYFLYFLSVPLHHITIFAISVPCSLLVTAVPSSPSLSSLSWGFFLSLHPVFPFPPFISRKDTSSSPHDVKLKVVSGASHPEQRPLSWSWRQ